MPFKDGKREEKEMCSLSIPCRGKCDIINIIIFTRIREIRSVYEEFN